jgi:hypothetical protein
MASLTKLAMCNAKTNTGQENGTNDEMATDSMQTRDFETPLTIRKEHGMDDDEP